MINGKHPSRGTVLSGQGRTARRRDTQVQNQDCDMDHKKVAEKYGIDWDKYKDTESASHQFDAYRYQRIPSYGDEFGLNFRADLETEQYVNINQEHGRRRTAPIQDVSGIFRGGSGQADHNFDGAVSEL